MIASRRLAATALLVFALASVIACGGGSGAKPTPTNTPLSTATRSPPPATIVAGSATDSFYSVYFVDALHGWVAGTKNGSAVIVATTDGGKTWQQQYSGAPSIGNLQFVSPLIGWAVAGGDTNLLQTTDGGKTWLPISHISLPISLDFITADLGREIGTDGILMETTDGGKTWATVPTSTKMRSLCFSDTDNGWAATTEGQVFRTNDGARTWVAAFTAPPALRELNSAGVWCSGKNVAWVLFGDGVAAFQEKYAVYRTVDGSQWYPAMSYGFPELQVPESGAEPGPLSLVDPNTAYFVVECGACQENKNVYIQRTRDGGQSWGPAMAIPQLSRTSAIVFADADRGWAVGTHIDALPPFATYPIIFATSDGGKTWVRQYP